MAKLIQASLTALVSIAVAALVTVAVVPSHARGGVADEAAIPGIRFAVLVESTSAPSCPALTPRGSGSACPYLSGLAQRDGSSPRGTLPFDDAARAACPYLSALAARSGCPGLSTRSDAAACPFLSGKARPDASPRVPRSGDVPRALTL